MGLPSHNSTTLPRVLKNGIEFIDNILILKIYFDLSRFFDFMPLLINQKVVYN